MTNERANKVRCILGEIERHIAEDTDYLQQLESLGFDLQREIDGYNSVITALAQIAEDV